MPIREVKVVLEVVEDELAGSETIVPSERDFSAGEDALGRLVKQLGDAKARKDKAGASLLDRQIAALRQGLDDLRAQRAANIGRAVKTTYTLLKPTYGRWLEAEGLAKKMNEDGVPIVDRLRLQDEILPDHVKGMSPEQVRELSPNIAVYLWGILENAIWPDPTRLPFSSPQSRTSTTAS